MSQATLIPPREAKRKVRLGVVSFINTLPLIDGLESTRDLQLKYSVPSQLVNQLLTDEVDVALCSSIDYQRSQEPLVILPAGLLGCDGPTLTVRLYSQRPISEITTIHCDTDSHTSIILLRILLRELYDLDPQLIEYEVREQVANNQPIDLPEAMLLIGDKVVTDSPPAVRYPHQLDLGEAWGELTGGPFVFAAWMAKKTTEASILNTALIALDHQRRHNHQRLGVIIHHRVKPRNWPGELAEEYLSQRITYEFTQTRLIAMELFFQKAFEHQFIGALKPVELFSA